MNYQLLSVLRSRGLCTPQSCMTLCLAPVGFLPPSEHRGICTP